MKKRWTLNTNANPETVERLQSELKISKSLVQILVQRGIDTYEKAFDFFNPQLNKLHSPFLMKDMDVAIERIEKALSDNEKILIYGDYDVDGTTAVTLCFSFFSQFTNEIDYYIPDRNTEGYGVSMQGIDYAAENGLTLIIALDCGITAVDKVAYAKSLGIDFIIGDHHLPSEKLPNAIAVLDPKRIDCAYPFKELSGCGIGFKLVQAFCESRGLKADNYLQYLDLCMVSIGADIVPIVGENRILAFHGLEKINFNPLPGLKALMEVSGKTDTYNITDVVFLLAPRINAAGRMKHAKEAVQMLLSADTKLAREHSELVNQYNKERKEFDQNITKEALEMIRNSEILINRKSTVVYHKSWNKGVIGIVASRLTETYYRPTIVLTQSNGKFTGSARSVAGFDLHKALTACGDLLVQFGGHKFAAGMTIEENMLELFANRFEEVVSESIDADLLIPEILIDTEIDFIQITEQFNNTLKRMAPFGPENMTPIFLTRGVSCKTNPQKVGDNHLKLYLHQNSVNFDAIAFGFGEYEYLLENNIFNICYTIETNTWNKEERLQLNIKGISIND